MKHFELIGRLEVKKLQAICERSVFQPLRVTKYSLQELVALREQIEIPSSDGAHDNSTALYLRYAPELSRRSVFSLATEDTPAFTRPWRETIAELNCLTQRRLARALVIKLAPGGCIVPHTDKGLFFDKTDRVHLVIQTNAQVSMHIEDETQEMIEGEAWWFNDHVEHWGENRGATPRIHLVADYWRA